MSGETSSTSLTRDAAMRHIQIHLDSMDDELKQLQKVTRDASDSKSDVISKYGEKLRSDLMSGSLFGNPEAIEKDKIIKKLRETVEELQSTCSNELNDDEALGDISFEEFRGYHARALNEVVIPTLSEIYRTVESNGVNASGYINPLLSRKDCKKNLPDGEKTMGIDCGVTDVENTHAINAPLDHDTAMEHSYISEKPYGSMAFFWKTDLDHSAFTIYDYVGALNLMSQRTVTKNGTHHPLNAIYLGDTYMCKLHLKYPTDEAASRLFDHERINSTFWYFGMSDVLSKRVQIMNDFLGEFGEIEILEYVDMGVDLSNVESVPRNGDLTDTDEKDYLEYVPGIDLGPISGHMITLYGENRGNGNTNIMSKAMNPFEIKSAIQDVMIQNVSDFIEDKDLNSAIFFLDKLFRVVSKKVEDWYETLFLMYRGERTSVTRHDIAMKRFMQDFYGELFSITDGKLRDECIDDIKPVGFPHMRNALKKLVTKYIIIFVMVKIFMGPAKFETDRLKIISEFDKDIHELPVDGSSDRGSVIVVFPPLEINGIRTKSHVLPFEE